MEAGGAEAEKPAAAGVVVSLSQPNHTKGHTVYDSTRVQWTMTVTIYHGPRFGHAIELATETMGRPQYSTHDTIGKWNTFGCPLEIVKNAQAAVSAVLAGHIVDHYGVKEQLSGWEAEPEPF